MTLRWTPPPPNLGWFHPATVIATWFWSGLSPVAPGTIGTIAALPFGFFFAYFGGQIFLLLAAIAAFSVGVWAADRYAQSHGEEDPGAIVIDEVAAIWLVMAVMPLTPLGVLSAFLLFRLFDITKPIPIRKLEHLLPGGLGVMVDDVMAALYAVATYWVALEVFNRVSI